jgi:hypothetical protein
MSREPKYAWRATHVPVRFGYRYPDHKAFNPDLPGLRYYLDCVGPFRNFSVDEITRPHHAELAASLGFGDRLMAPRAWWPRYAALLAISQELRDELGSPVKVRNAFRPETYNDSVGGAPLSDHRDALAFDLDFRSPKVRLRAEEVLRALRASDPWLRLSLGLGNKSIHVGILTNKGERTWKYQSYPGEKRDD